MTEKFYGVYIRDDSIPGGKLIAYCRTKQIATRELKKYHDDWDSKPPKPDDYHIREFEMIVEQARPLYTNLLEGMYLLSFLLKIYKNWKNTNIIKQHIIKK